jgi:hypothetical protein
MADGEEERPLLRAIYGDTKNAKKDPSCMLV